MDISGSSSGRSNMRSSRSPYVVLALLFVTAFLAFRYWKQTSRNGVLTRELETLQMDFHVVSDKHLKKEKEVVEIGTDLEDKKAKLAKMEAKVGETAKKFDESQKEISSLKDQLKKAQEGEDTAKKSAENAQTEKGQITGELEKMKKTVADLQSAPKTCDKLACKEHLREVLKAMVDSVGKPPVSGALKKHNVDVMSVAADLLEGGGSAKAEGSEVNQA